MPDVLEKVLELTWLIPVLPMLAFGLILLTGRKGPGQGAYIAIGAISASFLLSVCVAGWAVYHAFSGHEFEPFARSAVWAVVGELPIRMGFAVDQLTAMMLIVVSLVAMVVQIYSIGYMHGDARYPRFFGYLSLFSAAMLGLVVADNLLLFFVCWELVGLTSYLLIGFWFERPSAMRAAKKAFIVTRIGDVGLFLGLMLLFWYAGSVDLKAIFSSIPTMLGLTVSLGSLQIPVVPLAGLLLFAGAVGKSAQFPLHVWLPDAMEGPTPVSALIHAATMVAAGVYLVGRMYPVFAYDEASISLTVVAITGAITALMAATIATVTNDIKRVLAYSTISQLGYMMLALGVGGYTAGLFHLLTHAFFKANLFLGSGSVIHGTGTQDIQQMGGLHRHMPKTHWTFVISTAALVGLPFTAGFFSKDEILLATFRHSIPLFSIGVAVAFLTALYMTRLVALTFWGEPRTHETHAHESPNVMTIPLIILAVLSIVGGWVGLPPFNWFHHFLHFGEGEAPAFSWVVAGLASSAAFLGIFIGLAMFWKRVISPAFFREKFDGLYRLLVNKYYLDELYWAALVVPLFWVTRTCNRFDAKVVDGLVNGAAYFTVGLSILQGWLDKWLVDGLVNLIGGVTKLSGRVLRYTQTGVLQNYVTVIFLGVVVITLAYLYR